MSKGNIIENIDKLGLCLGCGLCESVCGKENVEMRLGEDGFFHPNVKNNNIEKSRIIEQICPGTNIVNDIPFDKEESIWGHIEKLWAGFSTDNDIRTRGSSGGIASAIAIYLLENKIVDSILQVGGDVNDYERNSLKVSRSRQDVLNCASSRYAPALIFDKIFDILNSKGGESFCFIGKPCDISALKNFLVAYPQFRHRFKLTISIVCAGLPSFQGTREIINEFQATAPVRNLVYRGNGWPGYFSFVDATEKTYKKTYNDSWGKTLNKHLKFRCKVCPDGIGIQADIAVGDAWETDDGYPDFSEKDGRSLVIARTRAGVEILNQAEVDSSIVLEDLEIKKIRIMQPYQFGRRTRVAARLMALKLVKGKALNFKNLKLFYNFRFVKKKTLIKEFIGTFKRLL
ncbi:MAG: Coenzyme F420 hydrogenase/dehydrogenase, beta subunit C-terminal domain [Pseudosphingobacterium sp.]|nr:Coenzyme F420 hydrogenase/dehydrogenase, beta subunit C-terminal domain [Pseudosphingobacterium sp.]